MHREMRDSPHSSQYALTDPNDLAKLDVEHDAEAKPTSEQASPLRSLSPILFDDNASKEPQDNKLAFSLLMLAVCLTALIVSLDLSIVAPAIPHITDQFHSPDDVGWYGGAYLLTSCAFQPTFGRIYAHFNVRTSYIMALVCFEVGSLICGVAPNSSALIVGRAFAGVGSAGLISGNLAIIALTSRLEKRPIFLGLVGSIFGIGSVCGPIIGGALTSKASWRWCFYINLPVGAITFVAVLLFFHPRNPTQGTINTKVDGFFAKILQLDIVGNILVIGSVVMLLLSLQWGGVKYAWDSARIIGLLVGFSIGILLFIGWQVYYGEKALIPLHVITRRTVAASIVSAFFTSAATLVYSYYLPYWFQAIRDASPMKSGVDMIPFVVANLVVAVIAGGVVTKTGYYNPPIIFGAALGTIGAGLLYTLDVNTSTARWIGYEIVAAAGLGMVVQNYFLAIQAVLPEDEVPIGTAAVMFAQFLGGAVFVAVGSSLVRNKLSSGLQSFTGIDIAAVLEAGATDIQKLIPANEITRFVGLYNDALKDVFLMVIPLSSLACLLSLGMEWRSLKKQ